MVLFLVIKGAAKKTAPQLVEKPPLDRIFDQLTPFSTAKPSKTKIGQSLALPRFLGYDLDLGGNPDGFPLRPLSFRKRKVWTFSTD